MRIKNAFLRWLGKMTGLPKKTAEIIIRGHVQAVGYRQWLKKIAKTNRVNGYVQNRPDETVYAVLSGSLADIETVILACWNGPPKANVLDVELKWSAKKVEDGFKIIR